MRYNIPLSMAMGHFCLFYAEHTELWTQCAAIMREGLNQDGRWLYIADEHSCDVVRTGLAHTSLNEGNDKGAEGETRGQVLDAKAFHFQASPLRIAPIVHDIEAAITQVISGPVAHLLIFVEMSWAVRTPSASVYLAEYEAAIQHLQEQHHITIVCLYNTNVLLDSQLLTGLHAHEHVCTKEGALPNPHYLPAPLLAHPNPRGQFEFWLSQMQGASGLTTKTNKPGPQSERRYNLESFAPLLATDTDQGRWKIRCFGHLHVYRDNGDIVEWQLGGGATAKTKSLFAYLLVRGEQGATLEEIADLLWPEATDMKQSLNRLYHTVRCLRLALSPNLQIGRQSSFLIHRDQRYFLAVPPNTWIDLPMFQEQCYHGEAHLKTNVFEQALLCFQSAERLYSGDLFSDIPEKYAANREQDWCWSRRYWFRDMYIKALACMASIHRQMQSITEALAYCDKALQLDPVYELAHQEKMRAYASVNRADALQRQYRLFCKSLEHFEMGAPTSSTTQLYKALCATSEN